MLHDHVLRLDSSGPSKLIALQVIGAGVTGAGVGAGVGLAAKQATHVAYQFVPSSVVVLIDGSVTS